MLDVLGKLGDRIEVAMMVGSLMDVSTMVLVVPKDKKVYAWCYEKNLDAVKEAMGDNLVEVKELRGVMRLAVASY